VNFVSLNHDICEYGLEVGDQKSGLSRVNGLIKKEKMGKGENY
jgi:hypothetical protein